MNNHLLEINKLALLLKTKYNIDFYDIDPDDLIGINNATFVYNGLKYKSAHILFYRISGPCKMMEFTNYGKDNGFVFKELTDNLFYSGLMKQRILKKFNLDQ